MGRMMMGKRVVVVCVAVAFSVFAGGMVLAQPDSVPGGPWLTDTQNVSLQRLNDYVELVKRLKRIEKTSQGLVALEAIGDTNEGRNIYLAKIGDPANDAVMIITQQHGNEAMTTEAALRLMAFLATGSEQAMAILDHLYVLIVPRVNPDGAERYQRYNVDPYAPAQNAAEGFYTAGDAGVGWDINRYHWVNGWQESTLYQHDPDGYPENPVPEAVAVIDAFWRYRPLWVADFHHQGTYVTDDGDNVTSSILWPTNEYVSGYTVDLSKQLCLTIFDHMAHFGYATTTLYPGGSYAGIGRNGYGLAGAGSILVELKGGIGQKSSGMIIRHALEQMQALLAATADGSVYAVDPARAAEIPADRYYFSKDLPPE
ncbi:MAG: M14 family zinc carboxypeptidase [Desulfopila sp.]